MSKVFVLTNEVNDYNQHGDYFVKVFFLYPTKKQISDIINIDEDAITLNNEEQEYQRVFEYEYSKDGYDLTMHTSNKHKKQNK